jgi:hypothetical protein
MTVRPTQPGQTSSSGLSRTGKTPTPAARAPQTPSPAAPLSPASTSSQGDQLAISSEARNLQQLGGAPQETTSELSADRMRDVVKRMNDGHYDKPEVMDEVIRRMVKDL